MDRTDDPIVAEVRAARKRLWARFGNDAEALFAHLRAKQEASGRSCVRYPPRPVTSPAVAATPSALTADGPD